MDRAVRLIQWYNYTCPWNKHKHALARWAAGRVRVPDEPTVYDGIQGGLRMRLDLANEGQKWTCMNVYELVTLQLMRRILRPGDVFVDGGANVGLMTLVASRRVGPSGKVFAFEPQPEALARLEENLRLNDAGGVTIIPKCCWDRTETSTLFTDPGRSLGQVSMRQRPDDEDPTGASSVETETVRMDEVVEGPVRLIKLDVEGAELPALRGAERLFGSTPPHVIAELNCVAAEPFGYHPMDVVDWLLQHGDYRLHVIKSKRHERINRETLARILADNPARHRNVWFEPAC